MRVKELEKKADTEDTDKTVDQEGHVKKAENNEKSDNS